MTKPVLPTRQWFPALPGWLPALIVLVLLLSGCGPGAQQAVRELHPPQLTDDVAIMTDGIRLPVNRWEAQGTPRAVILAVHGFNGYAADFDIPGSWFAANGITVYAYDQRGFGRAPNRGRWAGDRVMSHDLASILRLLQREYDPVPVYLMGESMGGAVTMVTLANTDIEPAGAILLAPAVWGWQAMNPLYRTTLWISAHTMPWLTPTGRGLGVQASDNREMLRALGRDPLIIKETRIDTVYGLVTLMDRAYDAATSIHAPTLFLYGANDQLIPEAPTLRVADSIPGEKRVVRYEEGWHMLLRDLQREIVYRDVLAWIADKDSPLPSLDAAGDDRATGPVRASASVPVAAR